MLTRKLSKLLLGTLTATMLLATPVYAEVKAPNMQISTMSESIDADQMEQSEEELFAGYVDKEFGIQLFSDEPVVEKGTGYKKLTGVNLTLYRQLRTAIANIADGRRESTVIEIDGSGLGLSYSLSDLGVSGFNDPNFNDRFGQAFANDVNMHSIFNYLLVDCPYDLYWFDKTVSGAFGMRYSLSSDGISVTVSKLIFTFTPASVYKGSSENTVDTTKTGAIQTAVNKANTIVNAASSKNDYEKLVYYKDQICGLTSYNHAAADDNYTGGYGDPWQLIYVFDGDSSTNVVCEGYAKAFQYLCDKTSFTSNIESRIVSGTMAGGTGSGPHMWNLANMNDGKNYIVDVTNCDEGTIGSPDKLFLVGASGSVNGGYTCATGTIYTYNDKTRETYNDDELTLDSVDYDPANAPCMHSNSTVVGKVEATCTEAGYTGDTLCLDCDEKYIIGKEIPALGHSWNDGIVTKEATCIQEGEKTFTCTRCGEIKTEVFAKEAHTAVVDEAVEATCTEEGKTEGKHCSVCGEVFVKQQVLEKLGHSWNTGEVTKEPSCTETGEKIRHCIYDGCDATKTEILAKLAHTAEVDAAVEASCTEEGLTEGRHCSVCHAVIVAQTTVPALGHKWDIVSIITQPTYTSSGVLTYTCSRCHDTKTESIPKLQPIKISGITLTGISNKIAAGRKIQLTSTVLPATATNKAITWISSNKSVATVSASGLVTMNKKAGGKSVVITAIANDGSGVKATYKITCMKGIVKSVKITGLKTVKAGKSIKLAAKVTATKGANKKVKWTSSNTKYATVSSSGKVVAKAAGKGKSVKITAMATDGSGKKKIVTIKIK
ncbi:MAG: Ig-like domain-containing protein [Eubacteriales bacterium]|nr:Ig-like domain-containing protein [Eubacteriales bacterium]